ncbi:MAG: preprotein translocase subunit SecG [Chloroflexi bacterium]|nr:preprotein translocase subunit SecG [Chloroflexota bacterium]
MFTYLNIVQIIVSLFLIIAVLIQSKGEGFSGTFSSESSVFRTRRGVEKTLFQLTLILGVVFIVVSVASVLVEKAISAP